MQPANVVKKIPHKLFWNGKYEEMGLEPDTKYRFAVSKFDPYTMRCFPGKYEGGHTECGHTSVFSKSEWENCVLAKDEFYYKYAGHFKTDADGKVKDWDNWSGHFKPKWDDNVRDAWNAFWKWSGGTKDQGQYPINNDVLRVIGTMDKSPLTWDWIVV